MPTTAGHQCVLRAPPPGSSASPKVAPWSVGGNAYSRPQFSKGAFQREQRLTYKSGHTVFDESPNGTSLPMTYAPSACNKRQFSQQGFDLKASGSPVPSVMSLATPSTGYTTVSPPWGTDLEAQNVGHTAPPQGWQGTFDSTLHTRRNVNPGACEPRAVEAHSVRELLCPYHQTPKPGAPMTSVTYGSQVQDWQENQDSNLSTRRQYRGQGR
eukprot:TRINITY_DN7565_c0_g1_i16.p1 TRINITY_DN7565_c0_g1~~TRINITY_DN7565_c0_g1_i16.p1  ORF type:complete len:212 (+),score=13.18 TRINITY_DN7565_c0_g1_i16:189-824(+)